MGVSLAKGRVACAVAGAFAGRGGPCQSRIHSRGAIDLDSFSPGEEGGGEGCCYTHPLQGQGGGRGERTGGNSCLKRMESSSVLIQISPSTTKISWCSNASLLQAQIITNT